MYRPIQIACFLLVIFLFFGCATPLPRDARIYNLTTGNILTGQIKDARQTHGEINMIDQKTGESFAGEYTSIPADSKNFSFASNHWANAYGFSVNKSRAIYGESTMVGDKGTVLEIVYTVDRNTLHGNGVGRDNHGNRYKVHF